MSKPTACGLPATTASTCARRFSASLELAALDQRQIAGIVLVERQLAAAREDLIELDVVAAQRALQGIGPHAAGGAKVEDTHGDRKSDVEGKSGSVRVDTGGRRDIKK